MPQPPAPRKEPTPLPRELRAREARWRCPASWIPPRRSHREAVTPDERLFGQERALTALQLGISLDAPGYNVFVTGLGGIQRSELLVELLERMELHCAEPRDHVFVHHFQNPLEPKHLALPPGGGPRLAEGMTRWVHALRTELPKLLRSKEHVERRHRLFRRYQRAESQLFRRLGRKAEARGLALVEVEGERGRRRDLQPLVEGEAVDPDALRKRIEAGDAPPEAAALLEERDRLLPELDRARHKARALGLRLIRESQALDEGVIQEAVEDLTLALAEELEADEALAAWLGDCARFALERSRLFLGGKAEEEDEEKARPGLEVFRVNVVRSSPGDLCPVVYEPHPNYANLFGTVERHMLQRGPGWIHMAVRPGALLDADGGFLVLDARDVIKEAQVWRALKRTLQTGELAVHALENLSPLGVTGARPQPLPLRVKVVLVGDEGLYEHLHDQDFDFPNVFKVKAEFEDSVPLTREHVAALVRTLRDFGQREGLLPLHRSGLQALVERAVRDADRRNRLSTRIAVLGDFAREAGFFALREGAPSIKREHVEAARRHFRAMHASEAEWHQRSILEGTTVVETTGERVGVVNALTVVRLGPLSFGRPARVSSMVGAGDESLQSVDREVELAGNIHNKGLLQLENVLRHRYGQERPLPARMSLVFDQSYGPVDGDSASTTEFYAVVSSLSGLPLRQDVAVTGAIGMRGEVLAVGGVDEKVEGWFRLCAERGLTGTQGVLLPSANLDDLMLADEVVEAIEEGRFHLWVADHVDQGLALLTGRPAAEVDEKVRARLEALRKAGKDEDDDGPKGGDDGAPGEGGDGARSERG